MKHPSIERREPFEMWDVRGREVPAGANNVVRDVRFDDSTGKFTVRARDSKADSETEEEYDHVIVASGHFSTPNVPYYPGFE
ncbi:MAG: hypothetical protein ACR2OY_03495, partial [Boseongicola sp.]